MHLCMQSWRSDVICDDLTRLTEKLENIYQSARYMTLIFFNTTQSILQGFGLTETENRTPGLVQLLSHATESLQSLNACHQQKKIM